MSLSVAFAKSYFAFKKFAREVQPWAQLLAILLPLLVCSYVSQAEHQNLRNLVEIGDRHTRMIEKELANLRQEYETAKGDLRQTRESLEHLKRLVAAEDHRQDDAPKSNARMLQDHIAKLETELKAEISARDRQISKSSWKMLMAFFGVVAAVLFLTVITISSGLRRRLRSGSRRFCKWLHSIVKIIRERWYDLP